MNEISINGKTYQKATELAKHLGYTSDYVGQLCRSGKVDAQQVGRSWYVVPDSVSAHKKTRYRSNQAKSKAAVHQYKKAQEHMSVARDTKNRARHISVHHYESDDTDLIPQVRNKQVEVPAVTHIRPAEAKHIHPIEPKETQVKVVSESQKSHYKPADKEPVKFNGSLTVEPAEAPEAVTEAEIAEEVVVPAPKLTFAEKVQAAAAESDTVETVAVTSTRTRRKRTRGRHVVTMFSWLLLFGVVAIVTYATLGLRYSFEYTAGTMQAATTFDATHINEIINKYMVILFNRDN